MHPQAHYQQSEEQLAPSLCSSPRSSHMEEELDALTAWGLSILIHTLGLSCLVSPARE